MCFQRGFSPNTEICVMEWLYCVQVNVPYKSGNVYVYDSPRSVTLDYDLPPALHSGRSNTWTGSSCGQQGVERDYDVPAVTDESGAAMCGTLYDSPPSLLHSSQTWYDVPTCVSADAEQMSQSNRSSVLSVTSNDSRSSIASLRSGSSPSTSARSSAEVSLRDVYDTPRASGQLGRMSDAAETAGKVTGSKLSAGSWAADRDSYLEDYSFPRNSAVLSGAASTASDASSAVGTSTNALKMTPSNEMQDVYDVPRNQHTEEGCDYDVPAQAHSISKASSGTGTPVNGTGKSTESVNQSDIFHRQIVAKHDAILRSIERLSELAKKELQGDVKHWCSLVTTTGLSLRTALKELLDLGKAAENHHGESVIVTRLCQHCEPLCIVHASISQCLESLLDMSQPKASKAKCFGTEDLADLTELVDRLHPLVNEFCVFLHSNAADICRMSTGDSRLCTGPASPVVGRRQAPALKPKPTVSQSRVSVDMQQRPLPVPPGSDAASTQRAVAKENTSWTYDDYDYISISRDAESSANETVTVTDLEAARSLQRSASTHPPPTDPSKRLAIINGVVDQAAVLSASDRDMVAYYTAQVQAQTAAIEHAVSEFCRSTISDTITPEAFVELSKQVVVTGHKLVYIGDTVSRHVTADDVCNRVASAANVLCDCLKAVVISTKESVLAIPSSVTLHTRATDSAKSALAACKQLCDVIESYTTHS